MIQTRIDQFYKVTCNSRQSKNLKFENNVEDLSTLRSFVIDKIVSYNLFLIMNIYDKYINHN